jgi:molybdopterin-guanine dinucleotide biosynthesis protein A
MGRDKAYLPVSGQNLGARVAGAVKAAAGNVVLVGDPERYAALGYPVVPDRYPGEGPLGGILTALHQRAAEWNLVVACDMPGLDAGFLKDLLEVAEHKFLDILLPESKDGMREPLCAVYHREALGPLERAFDGGIRKVTAAFQGLRVEAYPVKEVACFTNLNTPEDWAGYAAG